MGTAINRALDLLEERKRVYKAHGVAHYRPWVFMITDWQAKRLNRMKPWRKPCAAAEQEEKKRVLFFAVAVKGAWTDKLQQIAVRPPVELDGLNFVDLFMWLSRSTQQSVHNQMPLPPAGKV